MDEETDFPDIPALLVIDLDETWDENETAFFWERFTHITEEVSRLGHPLRTEIIRRPEDLERLKKYNPDEVVVCNFVDSLPGVPGSYYQTARFLQQQGFTFTGATERAIIHNIKKTSIKKILQRHGIPTPAWQVYHHRSVDDWQQFPAIVKPATQHSSIGIDRNAVAADRRELQRQVAHILDTFHEPAIVEDFIDGREFRVSLLGNHNPIVLPPGEFDYSYFKDFHDRLLNWESKWVLESEHYRCIPTLVPAPLTPTQMQEIHRLALAAYRAVRCRDYGGLDIRLRADTFYVLEVNANPEISPDNSMTKGAAHIGLSFGRLVSRIINLAARRHPMFQKRYSAA